MAYLCNEESISHSITLARHHSYTAVQRAKASSQDTGASRPKPSARVRVLRITPRAPRVNREVRHWILVADGGEEPARPRKARHHIAIGLAIAERALLK